MNIHVHGHTHIFTHRWIISMEAFCRKGEVSPLAERSQSSLRLPPDGWRGEDTLLIPCRTTHLIHGTPSRCHLDVLQLLSFMHPLRGTGGKKSKTYIYCCEITGQITSGEKRTSRNYCIILKKENRSTSFLGCSRASSRSQNTESHITTYDT